MFTGPDRGGAAPADVTADLPDALTDFSADQPATAASNTASARITVCDTGGRLAIGGREFALVHLGGGEFRFAGWSAQRTLHLCPDALILRTRTGAAAPVELSVPYLRKETAPC